MGKGAKTPGSGRKKGTPNKSRETLLEICARRGVVPFEALIEIYQTAEKEETQLAAIKEAAKYIYPQLKAIEHSGEINNPYLELSSDELEKLVRERLGNDR